jgi:lysophospholipase L1-like esterase
LSLAAAEVPAVPCEQYLCGAASLSPYFTALSEIADPSRPRAVRILQLGDSHSAGESISGPWRDLLTARYGSAGRGVLPPGAPFLGFLPHGVSVAQSAGWSAVNTLNAAKRYPGRDLLFGISGFRLTAETEGAQLTLTADGQNLFTHVVVCAEVRPGGGAYRLRFGDVNTEVSLEAGVAAIRCQAFNDPRPSSTATLIAEGGAVTLTSWATFNDGPGVSLSNLGVIGAQLKHFAEAGDAAVAEELKAYQPDLIVLAFGTNEGFGTSFDPDDYAALLESQIARLRRLSGGAPILVLGAPDANTRRADLLHNAARPRLAGGAPARPPGVDIDSLLEGAPPPDAPQVNSGPGLAWYPPPALAQIRDVQRRVAAAMSVAFWDWGDRMGGPGAANRWSSANPPLQRGDRVHFTPAGGAIIARMLQSDLDDAAAAVPPTN